MFNILIRKIKLIFYPNEVKINIFRVIMDIIFNFKIFKLRLFKQQIKFTYINIKKLKKKLDAEYKSNECFLNYNDFNTDEMYISRSSAILKKFGIVVIKNAFASDEILKFVEETNHISPKKNFGQNYENQNKSLISIKKDSFLLDNRIIKVIEKSCGNQKVYVRQASKLLYFNTKKENIINNWTKGWHLDFPTQFSAHVILEDLPGNSTRMQAVPISNKFFLLPGRHHYINSLELDEKKHFVNCSGPKGTLYIHSGNILHRNFPVINTNRHLWGQTYSLDKIFCSLDVEEKKQFLKDSEEYISNLNSESRESILYFINSPIKTDNEKYFKFTNGKYINVSKNELTYL